MTLQVSELPPSRLVGKAANPEQLVTLLIEATGKPNPVFTHVDRVLGGKSSIRLLFRRPVSGFTKTAPLESYLAAKRMAEELFAFRSQARYEDYGPTGMSLRQGWEVQVFTVDKEPVVVVQAVWVEPGLS